MCTFECQDGYVLSNTDPLTCFGNGNSPNGQWDKEEPICAGK